MAIPRKQIGWSNESNLLWQISSQMEKLTGVVTGGSTPGIDTVLAQNQQLTNNRAIDLNSSSLFITDKTNNYAQFSKNLIILGDIDDAAQGMKFYVQTVNNIIKTVYQGNDKGLYLDFPNKSFQVGDIGNSDSGLMLQVNTQGGSENVQTVINNNPNGLQINFPAQSYVIGDLAGSNNSTFINVDDSSATTRIYGQNISLSDNGSGTLIAGSAGSDSGNFLIITINNQQYKINLLNP